jgi:hypothetical protein
MKLYTELEDLNFFEWLAETHNLADTDMKPEYLDELPPDDIHRTVCNAMAFRWFREKHYVDSYIGFKKDTDKEFSFYYYQINWTKGFGFETYEEAELACLKKLIEIVKGGNK